ncbi:glutamate-5-semialdehyde dehydrogenase [Helicobacter sp. 11S03491-1]|uniref:glutamate-5-semialdehyde dehydrogenase n=1 Tax=Helicobacter sp. 11S03491-1 TaxID=1476196 RepID=UPI000BA5B1A0|nr:glutamate-5-semialdehyde dehydrogenase [Helicobacter sp. 11S03491-1]PAF42264.1 glutamate-5-semialdehyde dehydrogenase [Helicobacter sp. 11S03491-1]
MEDFYHKLKISARFLSKLSHVKRIEILSALAQNLRLHQIEILQANKKDLFQAQENKISAPMYERLMLDEDKINSMSQSILKIASQPDPLNKILDGWRTSGGLNIQKISIPIGVIGVIYESRPNVTIDIAALCLKSGNICILKGGKEARNTNFMLHKIIQDTLREHEFLIECVNMIKDISKQSMLSFIQMDQYIDLLIPRGGESLINFVTKNTTIPIIKHDKGICHLYLHEDCDFSKAIQIAINAKTSRPSVCNAIETLLIDMAIAPKILPLLEEAFKQTQTLLKGDEEVRRFIQADILNPQDLDTEYGDNILNIVVVHNFQEALAHIEKHSSRHSDSIITENYTIAQNFLDTIDSACVYVNASTRFSDGGEFGFGAEVGISTSKLHARGPMGIDSLTTYKYKIYGEGQVRL